MSLMKKSDVKSHLSNAGTSVYPFGLRRSDAKPSAESNDSDAKAKENDISISPSQPISPEAVPNAQIGGSIGVPVNAGKSGRRSW